MLNQQPENLSDEKLTETYVIENVYNSKKLTKIDMMIYYNKLWLENAYLDNFCELTFDMVRSNGQIENDWKIYNPNKNNIDLLLPIGITQFNGLTVLMIKTTNDNQVITKTCNLNELKSQAFDKKYTAFGQYHFLNYFPNFVSDCI